MTFRIATILLMLTGLAFADGTTRPSTQPVEADDVAVVAAEREAPAAKEAEEADAAKPATMPAEKVVEARRIRKAASASAGTPATQPTGEVASAKPATQPSQRVASGKPTTRPAEKVVAAAQPATQPATQPAVAEAKKFPTPAELIERMKALKEQEAARTKIAYFDFNTAVIEKPADFSWFGTDDGMTLRSLLERFRKAREDKDVRAVLITIGAGSGMNLAQAQEIRDQLVELRRAGKKTFVYADSYDTIGYTVASGATNVCLMEGGEIMIPGVGFETMFYKDTLDKVGVIADYVQIGEYKGAEEPYTRSAPSEELRGEMTKLVEAMYEQIVDGISLSRSMSTSAVRELIDDTMVSARVARERGFVDHIVDQDGLRDLLEEELNNDVSLLAGYGQPKQEELDFSNPWALFAALSKKPEESTKPAVALIYAEGVIVDGDGAAGLLGGGGVGSETMREAIRAARRDENVKAIVVRIDSPGGSALASEVMWQALRRAAAEKPVIISIGSMAASGGYYLASAGDYIFADPSAIVGSIGVVGGKFVMKDLFDKVGLATESFSKGRNANLFSSNERWDERQKRLIRTWMQQTYDQFVDRIMTTRGGKIQDIDKVARGRIFIAKQAKQLGMVDDLGGLDAAIAYAADQANMKRDDFDVKLFPKPKTLADLFSGGMEEARFPFKPTITVSPDSMLHLLSPEHRQMIVQQIQMARLLNDRPVILMSPYVISVK